MVDCSFSPSGDSLQPLLNDFTYFLDGTVVIDRAFKFEYNSYVKSD